MGLLEQQLEELNRMDKQFKSGKISQEEVITRLAIFSQSEKRMGHLIKIYTVSAQQGNSIIKKIARKNLIGDGTLIDLDLAQEAEKIACPDRKEIVTRAECLDYSGEHVECNNCEHYVETRRVLLPESRE